MRFSRAREALLDAGLLLSLAFALPFVIILVGAPLALGIKLLLWIAGVR